MLQLIATALVPARSVNPCYREGCGGRATVQYALRGGSFVPRLMACTEHTGELATHYLALFRDQLAATVATAQRGRL